MNLKTVLGWLAVASVVWLLITHPTVGPRIVYDVGHFLTIAAQGISSFFATF